MSVLLRKEDCDAAVRSYINSSKFILRDYKVKPFSDKTVGFMGRHVELTVSVLFGSNVQDLHFFAKLPPTCKTHRCLVINYNFFSKEIVMYNTLVPQLNACLPPGVKFPVPKCFFTRDTNNQGSIPVPGSADEELIILENVTYKGYHLLENCPLLDLPHCHAVLKAMAQFHGPSILLEQSHKQSHPHIDPSKGIFACVKENFLIHEKGHFGYEWSKISAESMATAVTKMWPQYFQGQQDKVLAALMEAWHKVFAMAQTSCKYANVLCHGDLWTNNILFTYEPVSDGKKNPVDVLFVDLQLVRYAPPILDILLFLHVCTCKAFRDEHVNELLQHYYTSLKEVVSPNLLEKVFPFTSLLESYAEFRDFGRLMSTAYIPIILEESDALLASRDQPSEKLDVTDILLKEKGDVIVGNCEKSETYKERIEETFQECLEGLGLWKKS